jgi:tetratricopeptide (TPR) repeat protein
LLGALQQLERRILQIEHTARPTSQPEHLQVTNGSGRTNGNGEGSSPDAQGGAASLAKAQSLLDLNRIEPALACLEELLAAEPENAEALVKKGTALERLQKLDAAVACYDRAIALDKSLTVAYLAKGGLFNRMERFSEALACYEQALRTQEKRAS